MSHDRIAGMIWGFTIGSGAAFAVAGNPIMIIFSVLAFGASWWFAKHPEYQGRVSEK